MGVNRAFKDVTSFDKPREKALKYGIESLSDQELIAILLETGTRDKNVLKVAQEVLENEGGLHGLSRINSCINIKGVGVVKSLRLVTAFELGKRAFRFVNKEVAFENSEDVYERFGAEMRSFSIEKIALLSLDSKKRLIKRSIVSEGDKLSSSSSVKQVLYEAISSHASYMILMHNHPEGKALPSNADDMTTALLADTGRLLGIPLIDHLIIGEEGFFSYREQKPKIFSNLFDSK